MDPKISAYAKIAALLFGAGVLYLVASTLTGKAVETWQATQGK